MTKDLPDILLWDSYFFRKSLPKIPDEQTRSFLSEVRTRILSLFESSSDFWDLIAWAATFGANEEPRLPGLIDAIREFHAARVK